jgi:hypothetical protein
MRTRRIATLAVALGSTLLLAYCGGSPPSSPSPGPGPGGGGNGGGGGGGGGPQTSATILAAGDIGECGFGALQTGALLDRLPGTLLALGDLAYMQGSAANFRDCYDPAWGRHLDRTRPVPGNHEYENPGAAGYYDYFGGLAGQRGLGYYAFSAGTWRIIALNSELAGGPASPQGQWLRNELQTNKAQCTLAYWHRPLFSSGPNGSAPDSTPRDFWVTLMEFGGDVVLSAHDHMYEVFARQDADGRPNSATGIRQFTVGTGGAHLYVPGAPRPNSQVRISAYGVLELTLGNDAFQWRFVSVNNAVLDSGNGPCH